MAGKRKLRKASGAAVAQAVERAAEAVAREPEVFETERLEKHWPPLICTMASLKKLIANGLLPAPEMKVWCPPPADHRIPFPNHDEIVLFEDFVLRGLGYRFTIS